MKKNINNFSGKIKKAIQIIGPMPLEHSPSLDTPTIIVDGGLNHDFKFRHFITIGDGDSYQGDDKEGKIDILLPTDKDFSDLSGALDLFQNVFKDKQIERIDLLGFTGGRRDHEFINILEASSFLDLYKNCQITIDQELVVLARGEYEINYQGDFSLVCLKGCDIEIEGKIKYNFKGLLRPCSSHGLSNHSYEKIIIRTKATVILYKSADFKVSVE